MKRIVLVDNSPHSFLLNLNNGIPVTSFYDDGEDAVLRKVAELLKSLDACDDVRTQLKSLFRLEASLKSISSSHSSLTPMPTRVKGLTKPKRHMYDSNSIMQWVSHVDNTSSLR